MSVALLDGFAFEAGTNSGYRVGRNYFEACIVHFTAGRCAGDRAILAQGYANIYIPREPDCGPGATQFAEADAITWSCCEWNPRVVAVEFEKLDDSVLLTQYQLDKGRSAFQQLIAAGIAATYRDTPDDRLPLGAAIEGFVSHRSLHEHACDEHFDGLPQSEIDYMLGATPAPAPPAPVEDPMYTVIALLDDAGVDTGRKGYVIGGAPQNEPREAYHGDKKVDPDFYTSMRASAWDAWTGAVAAVPAPAPAPGPADNDAAVLAAAADRAERAIRDLVGVATRNRDRLVAVVRPAITTV